MKVGGIRLLVVRNFEAINCRDSLCDLLDNQHGLLARASLDGESTGECGS